MSTHGETDGCYSDDLHFFIIITFQKLCDFCFFSNINIDIVYYNNMTH